MHAKYLTIILNTGISNISKEIIERTKNNSADILTIKFPYLAEKILKDTLYLKKYQDTCFFVIKEAVKHYNEVSIYFCSIFKSFSLKYLLYIAGRYTFYVTGNK